MCSDVMGIALAVWSHVGFCEVFYTMDKALDAKDLPQLARIRDAFDDLPPAAQDGIMSDVVSDGSIAAIKRLGESMAMLSETGLARIA